jgi:uncharacterized protein YbjT (DUF2867 family)
VRVAVRRPDLAGHVKPLGAVGQVMPIQANVRNLESVQRAVKGAGAVINLVGIGYESGRQRFRAVQTMGARNIAEASKQAGVTTLVHMSALGADPQSPTPYARSKGLGETEVFAAFKDAIIIRPSIIFGPGDMFFNRLASMARMLPVLPVIGAKSKFQPVYVGDVAAAFVAAVEGKVKAGRVYEIGGPETATQLELMQRVLAETHRRNPLLPVPAAIGKLLALPFAFLPLGPADHCRPGRSAAARQHRLRRGLEGKAHPRCLRCHAHRDGPHPRELPVALHAQRPVRPAGCLKAPPANG